MYALSCADAGEALVVRVGVARRLGVDRDEADLAHDAAERSRRRASRTARGRRSWCSARPSAASRPAARRTCCRRRRAAGRRSSWATRRSARGRPRSRRRRWRRGARSKPVVLTTSSSAQRSISGPLEHGLDALGLQGVVGALRRLAEELEVPRGDVEHGRVAARRDGDLGVRGRRRRGRARARRGAGGAEHVGAQRAGREPAKVGERRAERVNGPGRLARPTAARAGACPPAPAPRASGRRGRARRRRRRAAARRSTGAGVGVAGRGGRRASWPGDVARAGRGGARGRRRRARHVFVAWPPGATRRGRGAAPRRRGGRRRGRRRAAARRGRAASAVARRRGDARRPTATAWTRRLAGALDVCATWPAAARRSG